MKRKLGLLVLALLACCSLSHAQVKVMGPAKIAGPAKIVAPSGTPAPTLIQQTGTNTPTNSIAFGSNVTAGNALYAVAFCGVNPCTITFSSTHETWPAALATVTLATDGDVLAISCVTAAGTQADTATATPSAGSVLGVIVMEWHQTTPCTLDTTTSPSGGFVTSDNNSTTISSGNITTTTNNDLVIVGAFAASGIGSYDWSAGAGYSNLGCTLTTSGTFTCTHTGTTSPYFGVESKVLTTAGTTGGTITTGRGTSIEYGVFQAAFKP